MNAVLLKEKVHLRRINYSLSDAWESQLQAQRKAAGRRFIAKLRRHNLGDLAPRISLMPLMSLTSRYQEIWQLDFSSGFTSEWFDKLK